MDQKDFQRTLDELNSRSGEIRPSDIVSFSEPLRSALNLAQRIGRISLSEMAGMLALERRQARQIAQLLVARKLLHESPLSSTEETYYETRLSAMTRPLGRTAPDIWKKVDD